MATDPTPELTGALSDDLTEVEDKGGHLTDPFDPTLIRIDSRSMTVDQLVKRLRQDEIDLAAESERAPWSDAEQSRLIESLLIRVPLPAFYVDATNEDRWVMVDGLHRLGVFKRFLVDGALRLTGLEFLPQYAGKRFSELPRPMQRRIEETALTVHLIQPGTPPALKFNLFQRLNTGGAPLSAQEIRHALNPAPAAELLKALASTPEFQRVAAIRSARMSDRECVLRFLAFAITPPAEYASSDLDGFLDAQMRALGELTDEARASLGTRFVRAMNAAWELFGPDAFRRRLSDAAPRQPLNKPLFEAWSVNLDALPDEALERLKTKKDALRTAFVAALAGNAALVEALTHETGGTEKVQLRFAEIGRVIREVLDAPGTATP